MRTSIFAILSFLFVIAAQADDFKMPTEVEQQIQSWMKQYEIPGMALAVVQGDHIVYERGFGFRDREKSLPVTPHTLFMIGSTTKAFTSVGVGLQVEQGKLRWDQPVREYFPSFQLHDPTASTQATMLDLMSHRTGIPRSVHRSASGSRRPLCECRLGRHDGSEWNPREYGSGSP